MANLVDSRSWWGARRGAAERARFGDIVPGLGGSGYMAVARHGELVYLAHPMTVYYQPYIQSPGPSATGGLMPYSRELPAGAVRCTNDVFGAPANISGGTQRAGCSVRENEVQWESKPTLATKLTTEGGSFHVDVSGHVYFGARDRWIRQFVQSGTKECSRQNFGPDPIFGTTKECWFVPSAGGVVEEGPPPTYYDEVAAEADAEERAQAARIAIEMMQAAQDRVFQAEANATEAENQARLADMARAQAAVALASAEAYRKVQEEAHARAASYAAEIAALAAANAADADAALAAAETAAEARAILEALNAAHASEAERQAAYDAANAATQVEMRRLEQANARVDAAQNAADQAAANAAAGGMVGSAMSSDLLLYGGLAALAALLILSDKG